MFYRIFVALLSISGLVFAILSQEGNIITPFFGLGVFALGIIYFVKFEKELIKKHTPRLNKLNIKETISYLFLFSLFLVTLTSLNFSFIAETPFLNTIQDFLKANSAFITAFAIISGLVTFWLNRDKINEGVEEEQKKEKEEEERRKEDFPAKFPKANKVPVIRNIVRWCYREGWWSIIILLLIFIMFTAIKAPYLGVSFTGEHSMKYNSHVEPAKYMYERNDPFWYQLRYKVDPVNNPQGIRENFGSSLPVMEWGLFLTYKLFPKNSLEFNTRLFTNFLGVLILFFAYIFFREWFSKKQSLLILFLIAINPIISFVSFVTVHDVWTLVFTFLSLIFLSKYIKKENISNLFYAGLFFGIGVAVKISIFLWLFPLIFIILIFNSKNLNQFIVNTGIITILSLAPFIAHRTSLRNLPTETLPSILNFILWIMFFILIYYLLKKYHQKLDQFINLFLKRKIFASISFIIILLGGFYFLEITGLSGRSSEFLTDSTLIFYWDMYENMLSNQFKPYMTESIFYLGLIGFIFTFLFLTRKYKIILLSFLFGSFIYWIIASKPMFFHNYYTGIIMITFALSAGIMFYMLSKVFKNKIIAFTIIILLGLLTFPSSYNANVERLKKERFNINYLNQLSNFLIENTKENEMHMGPNILALTTGRSQPSGLNHHYEIKKSIQLIGFEKTMEKYNISYLITTGGPPDYERLVNLFTEEALESTSYRRNDIIRSRLDKNYQYFSDKDIRGKIIEEKNIKEKFFLEEEIGPFKIFGFKD